MEVDRHIFLIGFMGTGKSTIGPLLAERLKIPFTDLDDQIVSAQGSTIADIFSDEGEEVFRQYELSALRGLLKSPATVIALGGGAVTVDGVLQLLRTTGRTVLLTADWDTLWERLQSDTQRPLLNPRRNDRSSSPISDKDALIRHAEPILRSRRDAYHEAADLIVDTSGISTPEIVDRIADWVNREE